MIKKVILFTSPIIVLVEIKLFGGIAELLRQPSDVAVLAGVFLACSAIIGNFYLIKIIQKQFNKQSK